MTVFLPSPLHSYTGGKSCVQGSGSTLREMLADLDRRFPGIRFRMIDEQDDIRPHIKIFVNHQMAQDIKTPLAGSDTIHVLAALSGG